MNTAAEPAPNLSVLLDIPVQVSVELGACHLPMREVLRLNPGAIVRLDKVADSPVDLYVNDKLIARGEVVVVENQYGIKVTEIIAK